MVGSPLIGKLMATLGLAGRPTQPAIAARAQRAACEAKSAHHQRPGCRFRYWSGESGLANSVGRDRNRIELKRNPLRAKNDPSDIYAIIETEREPAIASTRSYHLGSVEREQRVAIVDIAATREAENLDEVVGIERADMNADTRQMGGRVAELAQIECHAAMGSDRGKLTVVTERCESLADMAARIKAIVGRMCSVEGQAVIAVERRHHLLIRAQSWIPRQAMRSHPRPRQAVGNGLSMPSTGPGNHAGSNG